MRQSLGDCTGQDVLSCIFLFFIKLYLGLMLGRLERLFALAEAGKLGPESPLAARTPRAEGGVASAAGQASAQRDQDLISGLWASFVGWASSNPSYGSAAGSGPGAVASGALPDPSVPATSAGEVSDAIRPDEGRAAHVASDCRPDLSARPAPAAPMAPATPAPADAASRFPSEPVIAGLGPAMHVPPARQCARAGARSAWTITLRPAAALRPRFARPPPYARGEPSCRNQRGPRAHTHAKNVTFTIWYRIQPDSSSARLEQR